MAILMKKASFEVFSLFIKGNADYNYITTVNKEEVSLLIWAAEMYGIDRVIKLLVHLKCDLNKKDTLGRSVLLQVASHQPELKSI